MEENIIREIILENKKGCEVHLLSAGASIYKILIPDLKGGKTNIILTLENKEDYFENNSYVGATLAPNAGRIAGGKLTNAGKTFSLSQNDGVNKYHGVFQNLSHKNWKLTEIHTNKAIFSADLADGIDGFPGNRQMWVCYELDDSNNLKINYRAYSDSLTYINMSNHCYFNLSGNPGKTILDHKLKINADQYIENTMDHVAFRKKFVHNTCFDFRKAAIIESQMKGKDYEELENERGYNHAFILDGNENEEKLAAELTMPETHRKLEVYTTAPALVVYSGGFLNSDLKLENGVAAVPMCGIALEAQEVPNAPNLEMAHWTVKNGEWKSAIRLHIIFSSSEDLN